MKKNTFLFLFLLVLVATGAFLGGQLVSSSKKNQNTPVVSGALSPGPKEGASAGAKTVKFTPILSDKPKLQFFVMSFCPFGNQAESGLKPVADLLQKGVDIEPHYIVDKVDLAQACPNMVYSEEKCQSLIKAGRLASDDDCRKQMYGSVNACLEEQKKSFFMINANEGFTSMHGLIELNQDVREICAWNQTADKSQWWNFVDGVNQNCNSQNADSCWETYAAKAGLDAAEIKTCFRSEAQSLLEKEYSLTSSKGIGGSPTFLINDARFPPDGAYPTSQGETVNLTIGEKTFSPGQYRSPETLKTALCASWKTPSSACKQALSETSAQSAGGCGQ